VPGVGWDSRVLLLFADLWVEGQRIEDMSSRIGTVIGLRELAVPRVNHLHARS